MALEIYGPDDFIPDPGGNGRVYPIEDKPDLTEIMYSRQIQDIAAIQANLVAIFNEWFLSFFAHDYFKFTRIKTQSTFKDFASFMRDIYKKEKPFLVIDPRPIEIVEDSIFAQNMLNRYNMIDPEHDNIGMKMMYALPIMATDKCEYWYRRNQYKIEFDVMIMEKTLNRQENLFNDMVMNFRSNSKFSINRTVPMLLPRRHIQNIARFHGYDWKSENFVRFMNSISKFPIIRRTRTNGDLMFYMQQDLTVRIEVPSIPSKDSIENSDAIEWGARVVDQFIFSAIMPAEFMFLTQKEYVGKFDKGIKEDPNAVTFISPIYADMDWPTELNGYTLSNRLDIELQEGDDPTLQILPVIEDVDKDIYSVIKEWVDHKGKLTDLVQLRVYPNGEMTEVGAILRDDGVMILANPIMNKLYTVNIYLNLQAINTIREGKNKKYIGTIDAGQ